MNQTVETVEKKKTTAPKKKGDMLKSLVVLVTICLVIAVAMAAINLITAPKIAEAEKEAEEAALRLVLAAATEFEAVEGTYPETVSAVYRDLGGSGYAVVLSAKGYDSSNPMKIAVGLDPEGRILKCHVVSASGETAGIGSKVTDPAFLALFDGKDETLTGVDAISGATVSSSAMIEAVKDAFDAVSLAKEGTK